MGMYELLWWVLQPLVGNNVREARGRVGEDAWIEERGIRNSGPSENPWVERVGGSAR